MYGVTTTFDFMRKCATYIDAMDSCVFQLHDIESINEIHHFEIKSGFFSRCLYGAFTNKTLFYSNIVFWVDCNGKTDNTHLYVSILLRLL